MNEANMRRVVDMVSNGFPNQYWVINKFLKLTGEIFIHILCRFSNSGTTPQPIMLTTSPPSLVLETIAMEHKTGIASNSTKSGEY